MAPTPKLMPNLDGSKLFDSPRYSDVLIKFSGREIRAHRFVLCETPSTRYFEKLFGLDSPFAEAKESQVTLHDDDPDAVEAVIRFLYNLELEPPSSSSADGAKVVDFYCNVVIAADKYGVRELVVDAALHLGHHLDVMEPNALFDSLKIVAERCGDHRDTVAIVKILAVRHLKQLVIVAGFKTWVASQPQVLDAIVGVATTFLSLEASMQFKCSQHSGHQNRQLVTDTAPVCCGEPMTLVETWWRRPEFKD